MNFQRGFFKNVKGKRRQKIQTMRLLEIYRTLMTRGQKGCFIYCTDKNLCN
ncbi:DNA/RNA helicase domain-containing protein [Priestia aryabhattai]